MDAVTKKQLQIKACTVRMGVIEGVFNAKSGHPGGSLSVADILTYLYFDHMNVTPGVDMSTGSLGQGISTAVGMALAGKIDKKDYRVYTVLGDGEIEEGQVWEAAMFAAAKGLDNLCAVVDNNNLQIDGSIAEVNSPYPIPEKFRAFGWNVIEIYGHSFDEIDAAFKAAAEFKGKPTAIIAKTVKGKGVSFMEDQCSWHGTAPNAEQYEQAMNELKAQLAELEA